MVNLDISIADDLQIHLARVICRIHSDSDLHTHLGTVVIEDFGNVIDGGSYLARHTRRVRLGLRNVRLLLDELFWLWFRLALES